MKWILTILLISLVGGIIYYNKILHNPEEEAATIGGKSSGAPKDITIHGFIAKSIAISDKITASGTLEASESVNIQSEINGRVVMLNLPEGRLVNKGSLLVKLKDDDQKAQINKLQLQLNIAQKTEERLRQLLAANGVSQQEYDNAVLLINNIQSDIEIIRTQMDKNEIRAPFSGILGLKNISLGAYLNPSTIITTLQQINPLKLDFFVPEKYSSLINKGDAITFDIDGKKEKFSAIVSAVEPNIDASTRSLKVRAIVKNNNSNLHPGAFAKVTLDIKNSNAIMVPSQAIIPQAREKKVIVCNQGKAEMRKVTTGIRNENMIQILDGLQQGDTIATTGILFIKPEVGLKFSKIE